MRWHSEIATYKVVGLAKMTKIEALIVPTLE
jgi:hypothetical protein